MSKKAEPKLLLNGKEFDLRRKQSAKEERFIKFLDSKPNEVFTRAEIIERGLYSSDASLTKLIYKKEFKEYTYSSTGNRFFGCPAALRLLIKNLTLKESK